MSCVGRMELGLWGVGFGWVVKKDSVRKRGRSEGGAQYLCGLSPFVLSVTCWTISWVFMGKPNYSLSLASHCVAKVPYVCLWCRQQRGRRKTPRKIERGKC